MVERRKSVDALIADALAIIAKEKRLHPEDGAEFFFRGETLNYKHKGDPSAPLEPSFPSYLDRKGAQNERYFYQEALRNNIVSFHEDKTMVERIGRMQHYRLPTRFADISTNMMLATFFAAGGENAIYRPDKMGDKEDGYIRIIKVSKEKMKSFTSDIITAIAHLPLVKPEHVMPSKLNGLETLRYEITNERPGFSMNIRPDDSDRLKQFEKQLREEIQHVWAFKPILNNRRIQNQGGAFLAFGCGDKKKPLMPSFSPDDYNNKNKPSYGIKQIGYVQIHTEAKKDVLEQLRMFGMASEIVYPDLSDASNAIVNHFELIK